ncbi:MAG: ATP-binding protein [Pseudomonadota bacterium]
MSLRFEFKSFKTRVARRVFLLFIVCAIVPVSVLGTVSYLQVNRNLERQHFQRLRQESRAVMLSIYDRFQLLQNEMITLSTISAGGDQAPHMSERISRHFTALQWEDPVTAAPAGSFSLEIRQEAAGPQFVMRYRREKAGKQLVARLNTAYVWEATERISQVSEVIVMQATGSVLYATADAHAADIRALVADKGWPQNGTMDWGGGDGRYYAGYAVLFLEALFVGSPSWKVVIITPASQVLEPMSKFKLTFPALIVFSLGLVFMLGQYLIRRSTGPIETLQEGTRHIADGEFGYAVDITSGDEFEDLGHSFNDMSRRLKDSQALLIRAARMGTMGQMASGIIHEVKQPLSAVYGLVQLVLMDTPDPRNSESLQTVLKAVEDLDTSLNRFRTFSQDTPVDMQPVDLNEIIEEVYRLLAIRFRKCKIECRLKLAPALPSILADRRGLQQVLSNLMINALDALEEKSPAAPLVEISTRLAEGRVVLAVSDNAGGIPEEIRDKIFDPFFTTKSAEKGTGLGMAIVEAIVHQHGAGITLDSVQGAGTTIRIAFSQEEERGAG